MAKFYKVRVLNFDFGFGKELLGFTKGEQDIPFVCSLLAEGLPWQEKILMKSSGQEGEYLSLAWYKKIMIAFFGPLMNYILAVFLFAFCFSVWGLTTVSKRHL
jgi:membrane-associated protease RseP (regulator of RpoE activity)